MLRKSLFLKVFTGPHYVPPGIVTIRSGGFLEKVEINQPFLHGLSDQDEISDEFS